jgi:hypothetical protein
LNWGGRRKEVLQVNGFMKTRALYRSIELGWEKEKKKKKKGGFAGEWVHENKNIV